MPVKSCLYLYSKRNHWVPAQWPPARILTRRWRVRVLLVPNAPTVADLPPGQSHTKCIIMHKKTLEYLHEQ
ncbi:hypothetical protein Hanom_Chr01g00052991 [Helianthus anomalus]